MLDSRKSNPNCGFTEDLVSYLYNELPETELTAFVRHLDDCANCGDELAAFSSVSASIQNWRDTEFAGAATPEISRSLFGKQNNAADFIENGDRSWIESLRTMFGSSPAFFKTAAAFGSIALFAGIAWFAFGGSTGGRNDVAVTRIQSSDQRSGSEKVVVDETELASKDKTDSADISDPGSKIPVSESESETAAAEPSIVSSGGKRASRNSARRSSVPVRVKSTSKKPSSMPRSNKEAAPVFNEAPRLTNEMAIDESEELRLSDIFSEIGS
ncbi:MAG: zf-HC2 domain-containing protein [Pyrinomonadaceae bacterium]